MLEAVDATLRSLDAAIAHHQELSYTISLPPKNKKEEDRSIDLVNGTSDKRSPIWRATHGMLLHRRELFQATRLRTISVEKRLTNIINLVCFLSGAQRLQSASELPAADLWLISTGVQH